MNITYCGFVDYSDIVTCPRVWIQMQNRFLFEFVVQEIIVCLESNSSICMNCWNYDTYFISTAYQKEPNLHELMETV